MDERDELRAEITRLRAAHGSIGLDRDRETGLVHVSCVCGAEHVAANNTAARRWWDQHAQAAPAPAREQTPTDEETDHG